MQEGTKKYRAMTWVALGAAMNSILSPSLFAADVVRSASVFEEADQGSRQVIILKKGQKAHVTGEAVDRDDRTWLPVSVNGNTGWVEANSLTLAEGDVGYVAPDTSAVETGQKLPRTRYWFGLGPTATITSDYTFVPNTYAGKTYGGAAISAGFEALLGKERRWPLGVRILFPWINETSPGAQGYGAGRVTRISLLPGFGYAFIPQKLEVMAHAGLSYMEGESSNFDAKIGVTPGVTLAWQLSSAEPGTLYQGVELGAFRIEETRGAADLGISSDVCTGLGVVFGGTTPDPTCTPGIAPAAYVFTLLYKIGGRL